MVKIRLTRVGTTNQAKYRIIAANEQNARDGKFLEILGSYDPSIKPAKLEFKKDRYDYWLSVGAQPSVTVFKLINERTA